MVLLLQNPRHPHPSEPDPADTILHPRFSDDHPSTPYVANGYFFSAPASPMRFALQPSSSSLAAPSSHTDTSTAFEFEGQVGGPNNMSSADELFLNGQIRPVKLSAHLEKPQILSPFLHLYLEARNDGLEESFNRRKGLKLRSRSQHRRARSLSLLRNSESSWCKEENNHINDGDNKSRKDSTLESKESETVSTETTPSRSSSSGRNSKKWIFLKDLLYRSKSEGRGSGKEKEKFWSSISFSPSPSPRKEEKERSKLKSEKVKKLENGVAATKTKRRTGPSPHEMHYTANRAQAEKMKKRTYLPYRQELFGCLGFSSKSYGALNSLARTLYPVSSG